MRVNADNVIGIVLDAAGILRDKVRIHHVAVKGFGNFVTDADKGVQQFIQKRLGEEYPSVQFYAEEKENGDVDVTKDFWILDPIDGTLNLMHDFAHSAISLGYAEDGRLTFGVIYDPFRDELFRAEKGHGAFMMQNVSAAAENHEEGIWIPIHVSSAHSLGDSLVLVGSAPYNRATLSESYRDSIYEVFMRSQDVRRLGAAVLDLAWVACGRADAYFEHVYPWDRAAGIVIVREAGGKVCSLNGAEIPVTGFQDICAGAPDVVDEIVSIAGPIFYPAG